MSFQVQSMHALHACWSIGQSNGAGRKWILSSGVEMYVPPKYIFPLAEEVLGILMLFQASKGFYLVIIIICALI